MEEREKKKTRKNDCLSSSSSSSSSSVVFAFLSLKHLKDNAVSKVTHKFTTSMTYKQ